MQTAHEQRRHVKEMKKISAVQDFKLRPVKHCACGRSAITSEVAIVLIVIRPDFHSRGQSNENIFACRKRVEALRQKLSRLLKMFENIKHREATHRLADAGRKLKRIGLNSYVRANLRRDRRGLAQIATLRIAPMLAKMLNGNTAAASDIEKNVLLGWLEICPQSSNNDLIARTMPIMMLNAVRINIRKLFVDE